MNRNVSRRQVLRSSAVVGAGVGIGHQALTTELTVTKEGAPDGFAVFHVTTPGRITPTETAEGVRSRAAALDWLGPTSGVDAYRIDGDIETFLLQGPATVRRDGRTVDPDGLGTVDQRVDPDALEHTLRVESTGTGFGPFAVTASGGVARGDSFEGVTDGATALDWVGPERGVDEVRFGGTITEFLSTDDVRVFVDGDEVDPTTLGTGGSSENGGGSGTDGREATVEFLDCEAARVTGEFAEVRLAVSFNMADGVGTVDIPVDRGDLPSDSEGTVARLSSLGIDEGINGPVLGHVEVRDESGAEVASKGIGPSDVDEQGCYQRAAPNLDAAVADVTWTGPETYEVTFAYTNGNDTSLYVLGGTLRGSTSGSAPDELRPGRNTFSVEWRPASSDERLVWRVLAPRRWVGLDAPVVARTPPAGAFDGVPR